MPGLQGLPEAELHSAPQLIFWYLVFLMISISDLGKEYGSQSLFRGGTINFGVGNRYAIVGANGSGKSTLLRIIAGDEQASAGTVSVPRKARVGVLRQDHFHYESTPILDVVMMGHPQLWAAMQEKEQLLDRADEHFDADRYSQLEDLIMQHDGYALEARAAEILAGLNIPDEDHREPLSVLSGGFKLRVLLAQTLASNPDVLLLDEPTNHLDILSIRWLEKFLGAFRGLVLVVSHDHRFLNNVCTHIVDVDYEQITLYRGNYDSFVEAKKADRDRKESEIAKREKEIANHKEFVERFRAKPTKARQARSKAKQMDRIVIEALPVSSRRYPNFNLTSIRSSGRLACELDRVSKAFGTNTVLKDVRII